MRQIPILMYHWFREEGEPSLSRSPQLEITPERFDRQMQQLVELGYTTVRLMDAFGPHRKPLPEKPIVVTFDDGTRDFLEHAHPVLMRHGLRATLFVVTGHVGGTSSWDADLGEPERELMTWDEIARLHGEGYEIGSHTNTHRTFPELLDAEVREELTRSREAILQHVGEAPHFLAYPRGFFRDRQKRLVREAGYWGACAVTLSWKDLRSSDDYELQRMTVKGDESTLRFRLRLLLAGRATYRPRSSFGDPGR